MIISCHGIAGGISVEWPHRCHGHVCDLRRDLSKSTTQLVRKIAGPRIFLSLCHCTGSKLHYHSQVPFWHLHLPVFTQHLWRQNPLHLMFNFKQFFMLQGHHLGPCPSLKLENHELFFVRLPLINLATFV